MFTAHSVRNLSTWKLTDILADCTLNYMIYAYCQLSQAHPIDSKQLRKTLGTKLDSDLISMELSRWIICSLGQRAFEMWSTPSLPIWLFASLIMKYPNIFMRCMEEGLGRDICILCCRPHSCLSWFETITELEIIDVASIAFWEVEHRWWVQLVYTELSSSYK
jgi:hypothetical protein